MHPAAAVTFQELNPAKMANLFRQQLQLCKVAPGETVLCISDLTTRREFIQATFAAAEDLGADAYEMCVNSIPSWTRVGIATVGKCKGSLDAAKAADLILIFHVPFFTKWLKDVREAGTRVLIVVDAPDDLEQAMSPPGLKEALKHAEARLTSTREVRVISEAGTDFTYRTGEYPVMSQWGYADEPGHVDHWGAGHVHTFPNEGSANGKVVFQPGDIIILPYSRFVHDRVELDVRDGFIREIKGELDAKLMRDWLDSHKTGPEDLDPYAISHLGWGMNPQAQWHYMALHGDESERQRGNARTFPGNFLFSTGPNSQGGGKRTTRGHYDVPMRDCTVILDNDVVIEKGKLVDPKMIVQPVAR
jgi:2,5-dihydroxypyridine 5,6-dioxygenase